jgi:hypothetical protein
VTTASTEVPLRIVLISPPPDETFCLQGKPGELIDPRVSCGEDLTFNFSVRLEGSLPDGRPRFLGRLVQGPPSGRFVYIQNASASGTLVAPLNGATSISARSAALGDTLVPGASRIYQVYYRDPDPSFCPEPQGSTFNVSNAVVIQWTS